MKEKCSQTGTVMEIVFIYVFRWTTCSCNRTCCFCIRLVFHAFSMMHRSGFFEAWQCRKIKLNHFFRIRDPAMLGMYKLIQNLCFWVNCTRSNCNLHPLFFPPAVIFSCRNFNRKHLHFLKISYQMWTGFFIFEKNTEAVFLTWAVWTQIAIFTVF